MTRPRRAAAPLPTAERWAPSLGDAASLYVASSGPARRVDVRAAARRFLARTSR